MMWGSLLWFRVHSLVKPYWALWGGWEGGSLALYEQQASTMGRVRPASTARGAPCGLSARKSSRAPRLLGSPKSF